MTDKEKNSTKYLTNSKGEYILNKDGSPRKKPGRPKNSELSNIKLALQAKNKLDKKNKKVIPQPSFTFENAKYNLKNIQGHTTESNLTQFFN